MAVICKFCAGPHPWFECRKKPEGWKPLPTMSEGRKNVAPLQRPAASPAKGLELGDSAPSAGRASGKKSTAAREGRAPRGRGTEQGGMQMTKADGSTPDAVGPSSAAGTQAPPVDTPANKIIAGLREAIAGVKPRGRPMKANPTSKRAAYQRDLMRKRRAAAKGEKPPPASRRTKPRRRNRDG